MPHPDAPPPASGAPKSADEPKSASLLQVAGAVFWSFFGIRKGSQLRQDAVTIKPLQVVVVTVLAAVIFMFVLIALVRLVVRNAG